MGKIAVLGHGVVGSGVVELFYMNREKMQRTAGHELDIKYILDIRDFPDSPHKDKFVKSIDTIVNDDEVTTVAECMGGVEPAFTFTKSCLEKGKNVCTSNKELVAQKGDILFDIAKKHGCNYFFEASVGGAIPIIRPLHRCLAGNDITSVSGILNGTTNFILTKMITDGMSFDDALKLAQKNGYAEADPAADIEGHDACRKICIISSLVYGRHVYPQNVHTEGITDVKLEDVKTADKIGAVKLIARVDKLDGGRILPFVMPMIVPHESMLSNVSDVFNAVMVEGDGFDRAMFYGRGAGKLPTASAVMGDIIDAERHSETILSQCWDAAADNDFLAPYTDFESSMYFRVKGSADSVKSVYADADIISEQNGETAFTTKEMTIGRAQELSKKLGEVMTLMPVMPL